MMDPADSGHHIFKCEAKGMPIHDPTKIVAAFGNEKCPKLMEEIVQEDVVLRNKALGVLCDILTNPLDVVQCVRAGLMGRLASVLNDPDPTTRTRGSLALSVACKDANGRKAILEEGKAKYIREGLDDSITKVRVNVYNALLDFSHDHSGAEALVQADFIPMLVEKAQLGSIEEDHVKPLALRLLNACLTVDLGVLRALKAGAVAVCIDLLPSVKIPIREEATRTLATLCFSEQAKVEAIEGGAVQRLAILLEDPSARIRSNAAGAVMNITVNERGKQEALAEGCVPRLSGLLLDRHFLVQLNSVKALSNCAVHPEARRLLTNEDTLYALDMLSRHESDVMARAAATALRLVQWKP